MPLSTPWPDEKVMIPDLLRDAPQPAPPAPAKDADPAAGAAREIHRLFFKAGVAVRGLAVWAVRFGRLTPGAVHEPGNDGEVLTPHVRLVSGLPIGPGHLVGDVLDRYPHLLDTFVLFGFHALANSLLRRTVARHVTIGRACDLLHVDAGRLTDALNARREPGPAGGLALAVFPGSPGGAPARSPGLN